jgi:hypothetical protein
MSQISEAIWIGSFSEAQNAELVKEKQITALICLDEGSSYPPGHTILSRMPWFHFNPTGDKTFAWIQKASTKLRELTMEGDRVMVYCLHGNKNAPVAIIDYFMRYEKYTYSGIFLRINQRRKIVPLESIITDRLGVVDGQGTSVDADV